jgi:methionine-rich copper-binding protein CopC
MGERSALATRLLAGITLVAAVSASFGSNVGAHEGIASAQPEPASNVDAPITEVTIEFLDDVADDVLLELLDPDDNPLPSLTTQLTPSTVKVEFDLLERKGTYLVRYVARTLSDGHIVTGAMSFNYGSTGPGVSTGTWILFGMVSVVVLAGGAALSVRRHRAFVDDAFDEDLAAT